jgi:hypothetical protein
MAAQRNVQVQTTTPVQDETGWDKSVHEVRVNIGAWGIQTVRVGSHQAASPKGHVVVGVGQTITYVHDAASLDKMCEAWAAALVMSERLGLTGELPPDSWTKPASLAVGVSVRLEGPQEFDILGIASGASPDGHAHVVLRTPRISWRIYDNAAMWSFIEGWSAALDAGIAIFGGGGEAFRFKAANRRSLP